MRIMAIDYGDAHTGIAVSDPTGFLAGFTTVIDAYRPDRVAERIALLAKEHGAERLVLGHPINMDGTRGPRSEKAQAMKAAAGGGHRPAGGAVGRAAHHHRRPPDPLEQRQERQKAEEGGGRRGGVADPGGLPHLSEKPPGGMTADGPGRRRVRDRFFARVIPPLLPRAGQRRRGHQQSGTASAPAGRRRRSARRTPWGSCCTTVWSQAGTNSMPGRWKSTVAQRLMAGHMTHTVRDDRARTAADGPLLGQLQPGRQAGGQGLSPHRAGEEAEHEHQRQLPQGFQDPGVGEAAVPQARVVQLHGQHHEEGHQQAEEHLLSSRFWHDDLSLLVSGGKRTGAVYSHRLRPLDLFLSHIHFFRGDLPLYYIARKASRGNRQRRRKFPRRRAFRHSAQSRTAPAGAVTASASGASGAAPPAGG